MMRVQSWSFEESEHFFITITLRSTLTLGDSTRQSSIYGQIELFNHLIVSKQMTEVKLNC